MNKLQGWISLHRKIQCHPFFLEKRQFSKFEAWVDLLLSANHKDNKFLLGNELIEVTRGSFITSELKLMDRWGWSKTKVRSFLQLLEFEQMIVKKSDKKKTTITICNYCDYQKLETTEKPQKDHKETTKEPQKDTNNNDNNDNKNIYAEVIDYLNEKAGTKFKHSTKKTKEFISARINENFTREDFFLVIDYCCMNWKGKTFANGNKGDDYLQPSTLFNNKFDERLQKALKESKPTTRQTQEEPESVLASIWGENE